MNAIRKITKRQFDAHCYSRMPCLLIGWEEVEWYEAYDRKVLGVVARNRYDNDFGFVILGRDLTKVFRTIEVTDAFYAAPNLAADKLKEQFLKYEKDGQKYYTQGDEKKVPNEVLIPQSPIDKLHPYFKILTEEPTKEAA